MIKTINISLSAELLSAVDAAAKPFYASRSDYIRQALIQQIKIDNDGSYQRRKTQKHLPRWAVKPSDSDEFDLSDDYE